MRKREKLTDKPILKTLFALSLPVMIGEGMQLLYNLADTFWVGQLGSVELAAISLSFPIIFVIFSLGAGFSFSGTTLVSQHTGAEQPIEADKAASQLLVFAFLISILLAVVGYFVGENLLHLMEAEPEVIEEGWKYLRIIILGAPLVFLYFIFSSVMQGVGDTKTPMYVKTFTVILNIIIDPFLIFGWWIFPRLGIVGAAYATIFSRTLAALIGLYILFSDRKDVKVKLSYLVPDSKIINKIVRIGFPASIGLSALSIAMMIMTYIVSIFGTFVVAAWGIVGRIASLMRLPAIGLSRSTGILVGQNLGAEQYDEAGKTAWMGAASVLTLMLGLAVLVFMVAPYIIEPFADEPEVINYGVEYLKIAGFAYAILGVQMVLSGALKGAGKTVAQMFFRVLTLWIFQIPFSYYLAFVLDWGPQGIWWGILLAKLLGCSILVLWFSRGTWKEKAIDKIQQHEKTLG